MPFYENDAVRTLEASSATIAFGPDDRVEVDQNSLVVITPRKAQEGEGEISLALLSPDFLEGLESKPPEEQNRALPSAPVLSSPGDGAANAFQRKAPRVELSWKPVEGARSYRVVLSADPRFGSLFADERIRGTGLTVRNLQPGTYYWRVRARDKDDFEGPFSPARSLKAVHDEAPPELAILSPAEMFVSPAPRVEIRGRTELEARVKINGQRVPVEPDGTFRVELTLREGVNLVTVEATDPAGNTEYGKRIITYKGAKRTSSAGLTGEDTAALPADLESIFLAESRLDVGRMKMQIPIVCLQTWEETVALVELRQIATRLDRDFLTWSASRGLMKAEGQPMGDLYRDPVRALEFIRRQKQKRICVLLDFRPCLEDPTVVRMLREMPVGRIRFEIARALLDRAGSEGGRSEQAGVEARAPGGPSPRPRGEAGSSLG